jgi:hypothetical protein
VSSFNVIVQTIATVSLARQLQFAAGHWALFLENGNNAKDKIHYISGFLMRRPALQHMLL